MAGGNTMRSGRRPAFWVLFGLLITLLLALPAFIPFSSINGYFSQIHESVQGNGNTLSWLSWPSMAGFDNSNTAQSTGSCSSPLRVYMYDIPRKYNFGMIKVDKKNEDIPWKNHVAPPWAQQWEVNKQHSVEYWLTVYLLDGWDRKDNKRVAVRVRNPEQADIFFVPFFASLSFNNYGHTMTGPGSEIDRSLQDEYMINFLTANLQEGVFNILSESKWWQASQGRDHLIVVHHPNAFRHYRELFNSSILVVADFGRYPNTIARLEKDIVAPYEHVLHTYDKDKADNPFSARHILLYFQGRISRKDDGIVRQKLASLLANETDVHYVDSIASSDALAEATLGMRSSRFCLHPAGDTPSSCRLFDAIVSHCVPVIISDKIELPYEDDLNYKEFSLFFSAEEATQPDYLLDTLRGFEEERWLKMWKKLKAITHHFEYQHPAKKDDAVNMIFKQVQRKLPQVKLSLHRSQRLKIADWWRRRR